MEEPDTTTAKPTRNRLIRASQLPEHLRGAVMGGAKRGDTKKREVKVRSRIPIWVLPEVIINILGHALFTTGQIEGPIKVLLKKELAEGHKSHSERCLERFQTQCRELQTQLNTILSSYEGDSIDVTFTLGRPTVPSSWISLHLPLIKDIEARLETIDGELPNKYSRLLIAEIMRAQWSPPTATPGVFPGRVLITPFKTDGIPFPRFQRKKHHGEGVELCLSLETTSTTVVEGEEMARENELKGKTEDESLAYSRTVEEEMMCVGVLKGFA